MSRSALLVVVVLLETVLVAPSDARAQLSPGDLASAHESLEGSRACLRCHDARSGVDAELCLDCHDTLAARVRAGRGLHARAEYRECETCHIDHQGRDFELVWWGEAGVSAFDHADTGWNLSGSHRELECRTCHRAEHVGDPIPLGDAGKSLDRTYLGLDPSCASCHTDPHRGQFADRGCDDCHDDDRFTPATAFDHAATRFALEGAHQELACERCHAPLETTSEHAADPAADIGRAALRFRGVAATCGGCHRDPHGGRLGARCTDCHDQVRWSSASSSGFDHDATGYPLVDRHAAVPCAACHGASFDRPRPASGACADCHLDPHLGQLAGDGGCASCHSVAGFSPSRYTAADHGGSRFPLTGRHGEQACSACHAELPLAEAATLLALDREALGGDLPSTVRRFRFGSTECVACHTDPHDGTGATTATRCESCHDAWGWHGVVFSHRETGYPLVEAHRGLECTRCHRASSGASTDVTKAGGDGLAPRFDGLTEACAGCHDDPHAGQLATLLDSGPPVTTCERCHADGRFRPATFDHQLDSRYPLEGAHRTVACSGCHPTVEVDGRPVVRYRPLPLECSGCHTETPKPLGGADP